MKPYGIPRVPELDGYADVVDIHRFGLASNKGNLAGKGGEIRSCFRSSSRKRNIRRIWKKKARQAAKKILSNSDYTL